MFLILNGIAGLILFMHLGRWIFSDTTTGTIIRPFQSTIINVSYSVDSKTYNQSLLRNDVSFFENQVKLRYLKNDPSIARVDSFMGLYAEPLAWWLVFLLATSILFFTNNSIFSKGTTFIVHKKFPWISMEEYFPLPKFWSRFRRAEHQEKKEENKNLLR
ncbi:MAG TPA: hypothetical protein VM368_04685 [Flavisolibacter sp.]|nr:hypothetical protein [Flavisolibacter sp.]